MKKLLAIFAISMLMLAPASADYNESEVYNRYFAQEVSEEIENLGIDYLDGICLIDGTYLISVDNDNYKLVSSDGTQTDFATEYHIVGQNSDGMFIISEDVTVDIENEFSGFGETLVATKYGVMTQDFQVLIEPVLDYNVGDYTPFEVEFVGGLTIMPYGATSYYYGDTMASMHQHSPANSKNMLINSDYKTWIDFDAFYNNFVTDNRYIVKDDGISYMIDGDLNVITDDYTHIIEIDDGKWYASTDASQTNPVYSVVIDNNANIITNFNPNDEKIISNWAESYISKAQELDIITLDKTTAFNASFFTKEITRNEFCRLAVNMLNALNFVAPETETNISYTDTSDENIILLSELGVINGVGDGKFDPYANITREQAAKILVNIADLLGFDTSAKNNANIFSDIGETSDWATDFVLQISALKNSNSESIMGGTSDTTFSPQDTYTVEQAITTLVRMADLSGNEVGFINLSNKYTAFSSFSEGFAVFKDVNYNLYVVAENGQELSLENNSYVNIRDFSEGLAVVTNSDYRYGYIDQTGAEFTECKFTSASDFKDGYATVSLDGNVYLMDKSGNLTLIEEYCLFGDLDVNGNILLRYSDENGKSSTYIHDKSGNELYKADEINDYDGYYITVIDDKAGCISTDFEQILPNEYYSLSIILVGDEVRFIAELFDSTEFLLDENGNKLHEESYDYIIAYDQSEFLVVGNNSDEASNGYMNLQGELICELKYDMYNGFSGGLARISAGDNLIYIDENGEEVIITDYLFGGDFSDGLAWVNDGKYGFIDTTGELVIDCEFDVANDFENGVAVVAKDDKYALIDTQGNVVLPFMYDAISYLSDDILLVKADESYKMVTISSLLSDV